ncbi:MAG: DUF3787 domain-containing protein [Clostridiaceae bacterium]|jgi:hypothetical protein|nr:DUF3787 domain-containing protein [Clostridiaceae bacterium]
MTGKPHKKRLSSNPIEKHDTAAWANIKQTKPISNVTIPSEFDVEHAREHVEENQK